MKDENQMKSNRWVIGVLAALLCVVGQGPADAQVQRDRFVVVKADELAEAPQRFWSRGIVFEDVLEDATGRSRRVDGRSFTQIETRTVGRVYVSDRIADRVSELPEGRNYLFSGTVLSESGRSFPLMRRQTQYVVAIDSVERLADDTADDLLAIFLEGDPDRPAFQNVQKAVIQAQNQLVARAQNQGVEVSDLIDYGAATMDEAAAVSRIAVRSVEQELGVSSMELLSLLVRELLVAQYTDRPITEVEPVTEDPPADEPVEDAAAVEHDVTAEDEEPAPAVEEPEADDVHEQVTEVLEEEAEEEDEPRRFRFFGRSAPDDDESGAHETSPEPEPVPEEEVTDPEDQTEGRRWFRRRAAEPDAEEVAEEAAPAVEEAVTVMEEEPAEPTLSRRERRRAEREARAAEREAAAAAAAAERAAMEEPMPEPVVVPPPPLEGPFAPVRR